MERRREGWSCRSRTMEKAQPLPETPPKAEAGGKYLGSSLPPSSLSPETKPSWEPANRGVGKWSLQGLVTTPSPSTFSSPLPPPMLQSKAEEEQGKDLNVNWPRIALECVNQFPTPPPPCTCPYSNRTKRSSR